MIFADDSPLTSMLVPNTSGLATVTVAAGGIQPGGVRFTNVGAANSGVDYTVGGGPIGGSGGITLNGTGNVTLTGSNTFTGGVAINAGTLIISSDALTAGAAAQLGAVPASATVEQHRHQWRHIVRRRVEHQHAGDQSQPRHRAGIE